MSYPVVPPGTPTREVAPLVRALFFAFLVLVVSVIASIMPGPTQVRFELRSSADGEGELFYAVAGGDYSERQRIGFKIVPDNQWHRYSVRLPNGTAPSAVRIDPGAAAGQAALRSLQVSRGRQETSLTPAELVGALQVENQLTSRVEGDHLALTLQGSDPYIGFELAPAGPGSFVSRVADAVAPALAAGGLWLLAELLLRALSARMSNARTRAVRSGLERCALALSDARVLVVTPSIVAFFVGVLLVAGLYVGFNLNQTSVGVWDDMFGEPAKSSLTFGTPKPIRSDEWNVQTPWLMSQAAHDFPLENANVGGERAPLLAGVPAKVPAIAANPKFLGFFLFDDAERGLSWMWAFKTLSLFVGFVWLFLVLTRGDMAVSLAGGTWVLGTSFVQWWFSSALPEMMSGFAFCSLGAIYLLFGARRRSIVLGAVLGAMGVSLLLANAYPPFIVPLAYLGLAVVLGFGFAIAGWRDLWNVQQFPRLIMAAVALAVIGASVGEYVVASADTVDSMMATVYPGHRVSEPGEMGLGQAALGLFEYLRVGQDRFPALSPNASEASSFILLAPFVLLLIPLATYVRREFAVITSLVIYLGTVAAWVFVSLPGGLKTAMKAAGWAYSPSLRAFLGLGLASICLSVVVLAAVRRRRLALRAPSVRALTLVGSAVAVAAIGFYFRQIDAAFFSYAVIATATLTFFLLLAGVLFGRYEALVAGLVLALTPSMTVNPVSVGADALTEKPILLEASAVSGAADRWVTIDDFVFSQGLKAHGLNVINGAQMVPSGERMELLDPTHAHADVWNRYANVVVSSVPGLEEPDFVLPMQDLYIIRLDVCGSALDALGVTRIAYTGDVPDSDLACLEEVRVGNGGVRIFTLDPPN